MKKSVLNGMMTILLVTSLGLAGCQQNKKTEAKSSSTSEVVKKKAKAQTKEKSKKKTKSSTSATSESKTQTTQTKTSTSQATQAKQTTTSTQTQPAVQSTILDELNGKNFIFSSGAGGWSTTLSIKANGTFSSVFHDSDLGVTGPGYPGGTVSYSQVSGQFTNLYQLNEYVYQVDITNLQYANPIGSSEIKENQKYDYTETYGISKNNRMAIYLPGTPISSLPQSFAGFANGRVPEGSSTLPIYVIQGDMEGIFVEY